MIEVDARGKVVHAPMGVSPCLTSARARASGHWVTTRGRRFLTPEMLKLQHMDPVRVTRPSCVLLRLFHGMIGNSMSVNVVEVVLVAQSRCAPSVFGGHVLHNKWSCEM